MENLSDEYLKDFSSWLAECVKTYSNFWCFRKQAKLQNNADMDRCFFMHNYIKEQVASFANELPSKASKEYDKYEKNISNYGGIEEFFKKGESKSND